MRYHIVGSSQDGVIALKRDSIEGALKKAGELRQDGHYAEVRIFDTTSGQPLDEETLRVTH